MAATQKRTVSLPKEQADFIDAKVTVGDYASVSEVVRAGIRALKERDSVVERWLRDEVGPTFDAMDANPDLALSSESVWSDFVARHAALTRR